MYKWLKNLFRKKKGLGLIPGPKDTRDYKLKKSGTVTIKDSVDLRPMFPKVTNQGGFNSCTAHAVGGMFNYLLEYKKKYSWTDFDISEVFLWYWSRFKEGTQASNDGVILRNVFKTIKEYGFVPRSMWDYSNGYKTKPDDKTIMAGQIHNLYLEQMPPYYTVAPVEVKLCLSEGYPVVFGFPIYENFQNIGDNIYTEFIGDLKGYHAMLVVGYTKDYYIIRNSWGDNLGDNGYYYIDCKLFEDEAFDLWTLK